MIKTSDFDYYLPQELIAQTPLEPRDQSRLMVINRADGSIEHHRFFEILDFLRAEDVLVFNDSRVIPARLAGKKAGTGGKIEVLLLRQLNANTWEALVKPGRRVRTGAKIEITCEAASGNQNLSTYAQIVGDKEEGIRIIVFSDISLLPVMGTIPLPPYIHKPLANPERYQTVYCKPAGSVAAPTAGLHFTQDLLEKIKKRGVNCLFVTLHVGLDTFRPVRGENPLERPIHQEYGIISPTVANELSRAKKEKRRVICVGTTSVRLVEHAAQTSDPLDLRPFEGWVDLFILPGYQFRMVDALITNFHLPRSTLLMLVTAFTGKDLINRAYQEAIAQSYRFYSFGDAMLII